MLCLSAEYSNEACASDETEGRSVDRAALYDERTHLRHDKIGYGLTGRHNSRNSADAMESGAMRR